MQTQGWAELLKMTRYPYILYQSSKEKTSLQERLKTWVMPKLFQRKEHIKFPNAENLKNPCTPKK